MAKKTSSNAIKKVNDQIKELEVKNKKTKDDTISMKKKNSVKTTKVNKTSPKKGTTKKVSSSKKTTKTKKDKVIIVPSKTSKSKNTKKTTTVSKNVRGGVVVPKKTAKKKVEKLTTKEKKSSVDIIREYIEVVELDKKTKDITPSVDIIRDYIEVKESQDNNLEEESDNRFTSKTVVETPRFILDDKPEENDKIEKKEEQLKNFFFVEDDETTSSTDLTIDDVDVIKFDSQKENTNSRKGKLKKKDNLANDKISRINKMLELDQIDKIDEYNIVEDFKQDIPNRKKDDSKKQVFTRKRKGKGYVVHIRKKPTFQELESDLRNLYEKVNDVVSDIDEDIGREEVVIPQKKHSKKIDFSNIFKKKKKDKGVIKRPEKKIRTFEDNGLDYKTSLLDYVSQTVLNVLLIVLFTIFFIMVIGFIVFVIYVSTF